MTHSNPRWTWKRSWPLRAATRTGRPVTLIQGIVDTPEGERFGVQVGKLGEIVTLSHRQVGEMLSNVTQATESLDIEELG